MTCSHCGIWRPRDAFKVVGFLTLEGIEYKAYCKGDDQCLLQMAFDVQDFRKDTRKPLVPMANPPLTYQEEIDLMKRILG